MVWKRLEAFLGTEGLGFRVEGFWDLGLRALGV